MKKYTFVALIFAASLFVVSAANGAELSLPVNIESVGKLKYMVSVQAKAGATVVIYDGENNEIHKEGITTQKLFNLAGLSDGNYRMVVLDDHKNVLTSKSFTIKTEVKRDIVAMN
ncbi:MAG: hypothetical protein NTX34_01035 [Cytophagales bacterium]|nr:hypothetical protein [Cytophagales bacterium]